MKTPEKEYLLVGDLLSQQKAITDIVYLMKLVNTVNPAVTPTSCGVPY